MIITSSHFISQGPLKAGGGDSWMGPINRQFSNMGLLVRTKIRFTGIYEIAALRMSHSAVSDL